MAGKSKSVYVTISDSKTHKTILKKVFFEAAAANAFMKDEEIVKKYPKPEFYFVKEIY